MQSKKRSYTKVSKLVALRGNAEKSTRTKCSKIDKVDNVLKKKLLFAVINNEAVYLKKCHFNYLTLIDNLIT